MKMTITLSNRAGHWFGAGLRAVVCGALMLLFTTPGSGAGRQDLRRHVPAAVARLGLMPAGRLPGTNRLNLAIGLPLRNTNVLSKLLQDIYDPASPLFRHYLTPEQFTGQFGPTRQDYDAVVQFAKSHGLQITATHSNRLLLDVAGQVADIEAAFQVTLRTYPHPREQRVFYAPDVEPSLDLAVPVLHISGLDNYVVPHPMSLRNTPLSGSTGAVPATGSGPAGTYLGKDFRAAYVPGVSLTGSGQVVGLLEGDGYYTNDITSYDSQAGLPDVPLKNVLLDGFDGTPGSDNVEVALDIDMVTCMAPGLSSIIVYEGEVPDDILNRMATDALANQLSSSWTYGIDAVTEQIFQEFGAQGQSFFNASGDGDAYTVYNGIPTPCDDPNITIVGGTTLTTSGPGGAWVSETVWNWDVEFGPNYDGVGSGGGISTTYPIPTWQQGIDMTANQGSTTFRNLPDVALTADNVFLIFNDGESGSFGGTSCATPLWAGFIALVNQQAMASSNSLVGFINPAIYLIGVEPGYASAFHDITTGNNVWSGSPDLFYAVPGYDLCTGWGSPTGTNLIMALAMPEPLKITPTTGFSATGRPGGPFSVTSQNFTLTNGGAAPLDWTLANSPPWLSASPSGGTLEQGGPATIVTASLASAAYNLPAGVYATNLSFINLNDVVVQSRQFTLTVINPPAITAQPTNQEVFWGATATFTVAASGGLPLFYQWQANGINLTDGGNVAGSATSTLTLDNVSLADVGSYSVMVSNAVDSISSSNAFLKVISSSPIITVQPANQTAILGSQASFAVAAAGNQPLFYQWQSNGTNLTDAGNFSGSATTSLTVSNVSSANMGTYSVVVSNALGSVTSTGAVLSVVVAQPGVQLVQNGGFETGNFSAWSPSGNFANCSVSASSPYVHSGTYGALLGPVGALGFLSQTLPTSPGGTYLLSLWLDSPDGLGPNEFQVAWNGSVLLDQTNLGAIGWTNLQFMVAATGANTVLQLGFRDDQSFLGLDDIQVSPLVSANGPPIIVMQPASQLVQPGRAATFGVRSVGLLPLAYQWQFDQTNLTDNGRIVGSQSNVLAITQVTSSDAGEYQVVVSNPYGSTNSVPVSLELGRTINFATGQNSSGQIQNFADALDANWTLVSGAADPLSPPNLYVVVPGQADWYGGWASNGPNSVWIAPNPDNTYGNGNYVISYSFDLTGDNLATAQFTGGFWTIDDEGYIQLNGNTIATLGIENWGSLNSFDLPTADLVAGVNTLTVTSINSDYYLEGIRVEGILTVAVAAGPPDIVLQPTNQTVHVGGTATFSVNAMGASPLYYSWSRNGSPIAGATNSSYLAINVQLSDSGSQFSCLVSNACGTALSSNAMLTVFSYPFITNILVFNDNSSPSVFATALSNLNLPFQLFSSAQYANFSAAVATANPEASLVIVDSADDYFDFTDVTTFANAGGRVLFSYWNLGSLPALTAAFQAVTEGYFTTPLPVYNWSGSTLFNGVTTPLAFTDLVEIDGQLLQPTGAGAAVAGFVSSPAENEAAIIIGNSGQTILNGFLFGEITPVANAVQLAANEIQLITNAPPPFITTQPASQTISAGSSATFTVAASGFPPLSYSWSRNGSPIAGASLPNYTINSVQLSDSGSLFSCLVSNAYGTATSSNAMLVVVPPSLVLNGGFEMGNFSFWTMSGNLNSVYGLVTSNSLYVHSGQYGAQLGPVGSPGYLSQTLTTSIGQWYLISLWLNTPSGAAPNEFLVAWNGANLFDQVNVGATGWTNLQFFATRPGTNTVLEIGLRNDPSYFALDDIMVYPVTPPQLQTVTFNNGTLCFNWSAQVGLLCQVQYTTNLASANWTSLGSAVTATGATFSATVSVTNGPQRFYRVMLSP